MSQFFLILKSPTSKKNEKPSFYSTMFVYHYIHLLKKHQKIKQQGLLNNHCSWVDVPWVPLSNPFDPPRSHELNSYFFHQWIYLLVNPIPFIFFFEIFRFVKSLLPPRRKYLYIAILYLIDISIGYSGKDTLFIQIPLGLSFFFFCIENYIFCTLL